MKQHENHKEMEHSKMEHYEHGNGEHNHHEMMIQDFKRRFWISMVLTLDNNMLLKYKNLVTLK